MESSLSLMSTPGAVFHLRPLELLPKPINGWTLLSNISNFIALTLKHLYLNFGLAWSLRQQQRSSFFYSFIFKNVFLINNYKAR